MLNRVESGAERRERARVFEVEGDEEQGLGERRPLRFVYRPPREALDAFARERAVRLVGERIAPGADHGDAGRKQAVKMQVVQRRQQLAMRQIAGAAEDHDCRGLDRDVGGFSGGQALGQRFSGHSFDRKRPSSSPHARRIAGAARPAIDRRTDCRRASETG